MLAQNFQRKDATAQRPQRKTFAPDNRGSTQIYFSPNFKVLSAFICAHLRLTFFSASLHLCVFALILLSLSCGSKPKDLRLLVPADSLIYLETNDLAAALQPIIDSKPFNEVAKSKPDFSALKGVQLAIAVTGFETSEEKVDDEQVIGRIQPHFVAIADTHAWNFQAVGFAEQKLGSFVEKIYNSQPTLEKTEKNGGKYFTWTAQDGRKAFALVIDAIIYFGNDETSIEKCLAVRRNEADNIAKTGKLQPADKQTLAAGYISPDGIAQIANIAGIQLASEVSDESEVQSAVAGIVPQLLRNSISAINWTSKKSGQEVEDTYSISMAHDVADVFNETFVPGGRASESLYSDLKNIQSATRYNVKSPQVAWHSVLQVLQSKSDPFKARIIGELSPLAFEPYGIRDAELFLSSVDSNIITANVSFEDDEHAFAVAAMSDIPKVKKSLISDLIPVNDSFWRSDEYDITAVFRGDYITIGSQHGLAVVLSHGAEPAPTPSTDMLTKFEQSKAPIATWGTGDYAASQIAEMLSEKSEAKANSTYFTETRFTKTGIERKTTSDFGLIGSIIAQLGQD